ncbi:MAG: hypothetical protein KKB62_00450 [Nanoarchaeota archaeon]|nr:hypothetical protein [Nanoarchaeota archaeon]
MKECYLCGISEEKALLYEGIHKSHGIVSVCRKCYFKEKFPLVEKKNVDPEEVNSRGSVRERLMKMAHVNVDRAPGKKMVPNFENITLRDIVERNFKREVILPSKPPEDLIENFHWVIMRKRRSMKLTKEQFAERIKEPVIAIESLEKGIVPREYKPLIRKVEGFLGIRILKNKEIDHHDIIIESKIPTGVLIQDIQEKAKKEEDSYIDLANLSLDKINEIYGVPQQELKEESERERESESEYFRFKNPFKRKKEEKKPEEKPKEELSDEDISKIVWGK